MCSYSAKIELFDVLREWNLPVMDEVDFQKMWHSYGSVEDRISIFYELQDLSTYTLRQGSG